LRDFAAFLTSGKLVAQYEVKDFSKLSFDSKVEDCVIIITILEDLSFGNVILK